MDAQRRFDRQSMCWLLFNATHLIGQRFGHRELPCAAWPMLLELYVRRDQRAMSIKALCLLSGAPMRTALRTIDTLAARRLVLRKRDARDRRQVNVELSRVGIRHLNAFFDDVVAADAAAGHRRLLP